MKPNEKGGAGYLGYEDKTFTIATSPDQWICTTINNPSSQPIPMNEPAQPAPIGKPIRYLSVCSGMEAASVAWHPLGWQPVGFSEIEPFPCAILKHRFPNTPNYGSLTEHHTWPIEPGAVDLLVGGTPCQSFSVAGLRKGLADPRGNLALTFLALADRLKPRWIVWENVPGVLSSGGGRDFGSFLGALVELGYGFAYRVLDAQHFGVPQRRRRVFVVACLGDWRAPAEVLSLREGLRGYLEAGGKKRKGAAADAGSGVEASGRKWPADTACTLNASFGEKQGLEDQHALGGGSLFVPSPICMSSGQANAAISKDLAHTLNATHETQTVAMPIVIDRAAFNQGQNAQFDPHIAESEVMDSLVARGPHAVGQPITFQPGNLRRDAGAEPSTKTTTTLKASAGDQTPHVAYSQGVDLYNQTLTGDLHVPLRTAGGHGAPATLQAMAVRRLTPVECERLQGFPDNWSRIPWKGKPEEDCPDGPRYKACGNSMAVPCMFWIGQRIAAVEASSHA